MCSKLIFVILQLFIMSETLGMPNRFNFRRPKDHKIVGGKNTTIDKHPYTLSLQYFSNHMCGASALGEYWALTAAHCFGATDPLMDFLTVRSQTSYHNIGGVHSLVNRIIRHENYKGYDNDIALLELKEPLQFGDLVKPIKIPDQNDFFPPGLWVVTVGWGKTETDEYLSQQLREVSLVTVSDELCSEIYGEKFTSNMMCANYPTGGKDSCKGDSGGPLIAGDTQVGIVSWGESVCGNIYYPGVYTKLSSLSNWIKNHTGIFNF